MFLATIICLSILIICNCQNLTCDKWLESMNDEFPYLSVHNSYHIRSTYLFSVNNNHSLNVTTPRFAYSNPSLTTLLSNGVVGFELDIRPQASSNQNEPNTEALHIYHNRIYDESSTCQTLEDCLTEINQWYILNKDSLTAPLLIYIDYDNLNEFSSTQQERINSLWTDIFDANDLYTPEVHNGGHITSQYRDWSSVCYDDIKHAIIPVINVEYHQNMDDNHDIEPNMFALCECQTQETYCVVLRDECEDEILGINDENRLKYLYRSYTKLTQDYPQWNQYPLIYNQSDVKYGQHLLGFQVTDELIQKIHNKFPQYTEDVSNILTVDQWQYWQTAAMIDALGNNNGKWDASDVINFFQIINPTQAMLEFSMRTLFWKEGYEGWDILNPLLWAKVKCMWEDDYGLDVFTINVNLSQTLLQICDHMNKKYHYLYADYPFNWTHIQDFTIEEIKRKDLCRNITLTTYIKQSSVISDCVSKSELLSTMYLIVALVAASIIWCIGVISVSVYCSVCYKKIACRDWCNTHCSTCCGREYEREEVDYGAVDVAVEVE